jgi:membrane-associated protease RseP (regulator of RpoE activity)
VAAPLIAWVKIFGFTHSEAKNTVLGIVGFASILIAMFNLLPVAPLDGAKAWKLMPALVGLWRKRGSSVSGIARSRGWR